MGFNLAEARRIYYDFIKQKYKQEHAWMKTAEYFNMTVGELSRIWNKEKRKEENDNQLDSRPILTEVETQKFCEIGYEQLKLF